MSAALYNTTYTGTLAAGANILIELPSSPRGVWAGASIATGVVVARWRTMEMYNKGILMPAAYGLALSDRPIWLPEEIRELQILNTDAAAARNYYVTAVF